ncbi:MAG: hypothetical protein M3Z85_21720, partial [Acidobacteriota bacterium]|nr:hypothetical protein [Acidobacteriota bacterium]
MPKKAKLHLQRLPLQASLLAIILFAIFLPASPLSMEASSLNEPSTEQRSQLPMFFVENRGQMDARVHFLMKRSGFTAYFLDGEIILSISGKSLP